MIGLGSNRLSVCRRGGMSVTQAGRGGMEWLAGGRRPRWSSPYSAQATAALKAQFPTQWPTIRDYGFAHPEIVGYMNAAPLLIGQMFAVDDLYAVVQAGLMSLKTLQDNSMWIQLLHHHIKNGTQMYPNRTAACYNVDSERFSMTKYIENWLLDSKFEFLAEEYYTEGGALSVQRRWSQTSNPYTSTSLTGFTNISNGIGIYKYNGNECPIITRPTWWGATGATSSFNGGIPAYNGSTINKGTLDLWIRVA